MPEIRLSFHPLAMTLHASLGTEQALAYQERGHELLSRVAQQMTKLQQAGRFDAFTIYEDRLARILNRLARTLDTSPPSIHFVIAAGRPTLRGVKVVVGPEQGTSLGRLSISAPAAVAAKWHPLWLVAHVQEELLRRGVSGPCSASDIEAAWLRHCFHAEAVSNAPILAAPRPSPSHFERPFFLRASPKRRLLELMITDPRTFASPHVRRSVLRRAAEALEGLGEKLAAPYAQIWERHLDRQMREAARGPQLLKIEVPLVVLAGVVRGRVAEKGKAPSQLPAPSLEERLLVHASRLGFDVQDDTALRQHAICELFEPQQALANLTRQGILSAQPVQAETPPPPLRLPRGFIAVRFISDLNYQERLLHTAVASMQRQPVKQRDLQAVSISVTQASVPELGKRLDQLKSALKALSDEVKKPTTLVHASWQLFPFTRVAPLLPDRLQKEDDWHPKAGWQTLIIREMVGLHGFQPEADWIRSHLYPPLTRQTVEDTLSMLERQGHIRRDGATWVQTHANILAEDVSGETVMRFHEGMMMLSLKTAKLDADRLACAAGLLSGDHKTFAAAKDLILNALRELFEIAASMQAPDQVYQINTQLMQLTKPLVR